MKIEKRQILTSLKSGSNEYNPGLLPEASSSTVINSRFAAPVVLGSHPPHTRRKTVVAPYGVVYTVFQAILFP